MLFVDAAAGTSARVGLWSNAAFDPFVVTADNLSGSASVINQQVMSIAAEPLSENNRPPH